VKTRTDFFSEAKNFVGRNRAVLAAAPIFTN
jgi:hypothetical protein